MTYNSSIVLENVLSLLRNYLKKNKLNVSWDAEGSILQQIEKYKEYLMYAKIIEWIANLYPLHASFVRRNFPSPFE